ncbi:MAG: hypothetical protein GF398_12715 [Chitinivibrionales bacterium]|nr:hypothetical protein [Chitinivibrionales bacterium]
MFKKLIFIVLPLMLLNAAEVTLKNGKSFSGEIVGENANFITLDREGTHLRIAKSLIVGMNGEPYSAKGVKSIQIGAQSKKPAATESPVSEDDTTTKASASIKQTLQTVAPLKPKSSSRSYTDKLGQKIALTLKNGSSFVGLARSENANFLVVDVDGSDVRILKNLIVSVGQAPVESEAQAAAPAAVVQTHPAQIEPAVSAKADSPEPKPDSGPIAQPDSAKPPKPPAPAPRNMTAQSGPQIEIEDLPDESDQQRTTGKINAVGAGNVEQPVAAEEGNLVEAEAPSQQGTAGAAGSQPASPPENKAASLPAGKKNAEPAVASRVLPGHGAPSARAALPPPVIVPPAKPVVEGAKGVIVQPARNGTAAATTDSAKSKPAGQKAIKRKPDIIAKLNSTQRERRLDAVLALRDDPDMAQDALARLIELFGDTAVYRPLPDKGPERVGALDEPTSVGDQAVLAVTAIGKPAVKELVDALDAPEPFVRSQSAKALGRLQDRKAVKPLIALLADTNIFVQQEAAVALVAFGDAKPLLASLRDRKNRNKAQVLEVLGKIKDPQTIPDIVKLIHNRDSHIREMAAFALGEIGHVSAVEPLIELLDDNISFVRHNAVEALGKIGDHRAVSSLQKLTRDQSSYVREKAENVIKRLTKLEFKKHNTDVESLIEALKHTDEAIRSKAANTLWLMTGRKLGNDYDAWRTWYEEEHAGQTKM